MTQGLRTFLTFQDGVATAALDLDYGFSSRSVWVGDRFGVTWQLNLQ